MARAGQDGIQRLDPIEVRAALDSDPEDLPLELPDTAVRGSVVDAHGEAVGAYYLEALDQSERPPGRP